MGARLSRAPTGGRCRLPINQMSAGDDLRRYLIAERTNRAAITRVEMTATGVISIVIFTMLDHSFPGLAADLRCQHSKPGPRNLSRFGGPGLRIRSQRESRR